MTIKTSLLRCFFVALATFCCLTYSKSAITQGNEAYAYRIKVNGVTDVASFKELSQYLDETFDSRAKFDDATDEITISSIYNIPNHQLSMKLTALGYTLLTYTQIVDEKEPK